MSVAALLNKTCIQTRKATTQDADTGGNVHTYPSVGSGAIPCAVQVDTSSQTFRASQEAGVLEVRFYFRSTEDIRVNDRLTSVTGYSGITFEVKSKSVDDAGRSAYQKVFAETVTGGGQR